MTGRFKWSMDKVIGGPAKGLNWLIATPFKDGIGLNWLNVFRGTQFLSAGADANLASH